MNRFDKLTKYIDEIAATECYGHPSNAHYGYDLADVVRRFESDFHDFAFGRSGDKGKSKPGFHYADYAEITSKAAKLCACTEEEIKCGNVLFDAETTLASMMWINRSEHWGGGLGSDWYEAFSEGRILKWLQHLKHLDDDAN